MKNLLIICSLLLPLVGCVSVSLPGKKIVTATDVQWSAPADPFKEIKMANVDRAWISEKTANTLSFFSECGNTADPSLETLENEALSALNEVKVQSSQELIYNSREAREITVTGKLDGVPVQMSLLVLKKNGCNYTLSYGGKSSHYPAESAYFETFKRNFKAP